MMMVQDLAHGAFQAAQDRDFDAMHDAVTELLARGPYETDTAVQAWMDRTIVMIGHRMATIRLKIVMISDHGGGDPDPIDQINRPDVAWAGRLFLAHAQRDKAAWAELWSVVPPGQEILYVERVLTTMALTSRAWEEGNGDDTDDLEADKPDAELTCPNPIHRWIANDRKTAGLRIAKAHLN